jgi:DNA-binding HxlR family transcriptional regulator
MVEGQDLLGAWTFRLLGERWSIRLLRELTGGQLQPSELEQRLPDAAHSGLMRGLRELELARGVARKRISGVPTRAYYKLTDAGRTLLPIVESVEDWERRWVLSLARPETPGRWTSRLLGDHGNRTLLRALAEDPLRPIDVDGRSLYLSRSATRRRLSGLLANGLLSRIQEGGEVRYALTAAARLLDPLAALAAQWERQWDPWHIRVTLPASAAAPRARAQPAAR